MKDYHDYVIKEGKLIGEFEEMYQNCDMPWHQDDQQSWIDVRLTIEILKDKRFDRIHDFACGLGYFLKILDDGLGNSAECSGSDISETAVKRAVELFPKYHFQTKDLTVPSTQIVTPDNYRSLYAIRGTLWYVFPNLNHVVQNIADCMNKDDLLLISQNFPPLNSNFVGKEVLPGPDAIVEAFSRKFSLLESVWYEKQTSGNENWFIGIFQPMTKLPITFSGSGK